MKQNKVILSILFGLSLTLSGQGLAAPEAPAPQPTYSLDDLKASNIRSLQRAVSSGQISDLRAEAIKEIALSLGVSSGLSAQFQVYEKALETRSAELDRQYNFEALKLSPGVLPPVLSQSFSNFELKDNETIEFAGKTFKIERPARMVSVYPTWRDYLKFNFRPAALPKQNFMPRTAAERALWDASVKEGWEEGVRQAHVVWTNAWGELRRDYEGMILYKQLLANNAITPTIVASANLGVTGDGTTMSVNHQVIKITDHSRFKNDQNQWKNDSPATFEDNNGRRF